MDYLLFNRCPSSFSVVLAAEHQPLVPRFLASFEDFTLLLVGIDSSAVPSFGFPFGCAKGHLRFFRLQIPPEIYMLSW